MSEMARPQPAWLYQLLGVAAAADGNKFSSGGTEFEIRDGIPRQVVQHTETQQQTSDSFGFKWAQTEIYDQPEFLAPIRDWLVERYGDIASYLAPDLGHVPVILDAGCGGGMSAIEMFGEDLARCHYVGADVSTAVDVAQQRLAEKKIDGGFIQCDLGALPIQNDSIDVIFSEGVLHHTDTPRETFLRLAKILRPGGHFLFYIYRKKGPLREFTDDYLRDKLQVMTPQEGWDSLMPLTLLGKALGELNIEIDVPEDIDLLEIPKGKINLQRLFYWHVAKAFYRDDWSIDQMNKINFDWYAPANASRHTESELREWCDEAGLTIKREVIEDAGITMIAQRS